jgi:hypothetical protein
MPRWRRDLQLVLAGVLVLSVVFGGGSVVVWIVDVFG